MLITSYLWWLLLLLGLCSCAAPSRCINNMLHWCATLHCLKFAKFIWPWQLKGQTDWITMVTFEEHLNPFISIVSKCTSFAQALNLMCRLVAQYRNPAKWTQEAQDISICWHSHTFNGMWCWNTIQWHILMTCHTFTCWLALETTFRVSKTTYHITHISPPVDQCMCHQHLECQPPIFWGGAPIKMWQKVGGCQYAVSWYLPPDIT